MKGEKVTDYGFSTTAPSVGATHPLPKDIGTSEPPLTEQPEFAESLEHGEVTAVPTVEQRRFSAPMADWDPAR